MGKKLSSKDFDNENVINILEILNDCNKRIFKATMQEEKIQILKPLGLIAKNFINELEQDNTEATLSLVSEKMHGDIIKPNECISGGLLSLVHFYLDDLEIYKDFIKYLINELILREQHSITFDSLILAIQEFVIRTFGPSINYNDLYHFYCQMEYEHVSIKDIYKKNWAVCIERTTFVHNLLKMLELDDTIITCELSFNTSSEGHVVNCIRNNDEYYIIDFTNYSFEYIDIIENDKTAVGIIKNVIPTVIKLKKEEYDDFMNGQKCIEFDVIEKEINENKENIKHCMIESSAKEDEISRNSL